MANYNNTDLLTALHKCAAACEMCMDACLNEDDLKKMVECIRLDRDCAKICHLTASFVASNSQFDEEIINQCAKICRACAEECEKHHTEHCKECARACRECEEACRSYSGVAA